MRYLITGGTGSLGNALIAELGYDIGVDVCVYSRDELKQAEMAVRFPWVRYFLGDVRDRDRLMTAMRGVSVVVHAAALKRVDAVCYNPGEVVKTNVLGTMNVVEAAILAGVEKVVVVSSDKAVEPMNIYGASKMLAEQYAVAANSYSCPAGTRITVVRYGNVLGSRGSVVEFWRGLEKGSEVKVVPCTRFWWTLKDAARFIVKTIGMMDGGEVFVPKLRGAPVSRVAEAMGLVPVLGEMRVGGEKKHEKLLSTDELRRTADLVTRLVVYPAISSWREYPKVEEEYHEYVSSDSARHLTVSELTEMLSG